MQWLNTIVDELLEKHPEGEIVVSSGVSPSGKYHVGTLREVLTAEAILREVQRRGRQAKHLHIADDLDVFRKVPVGIPENYSQYLGQPLCDLPAPEGEGSYADYYLNDLIVASKDLKLEVEIVRAHEEYRKGFFTSAVEQAIDKIDDVKAILEEVSGHQVGDNWAPAQVLDDGFLKNRKITGIDKDAKTVSYINAEGETKTADYSKGEVKLNWRIDWPARWSLLTVMAEPYGRDHAAKGGSYDTGKVLVDKIYGGTAPIGVPYEFINRTGETKKMSKSAGDTVTASGLLEILPAELVWFFIVRYAPNKQLFFDTGDTLVKLFDEFSALLAKEDKTPADEQLIAICTQGIDSQTVSRVPFSLLVASYQAALKDKERTLEIISRTEYQQAAEEDAEIIVEELKFIDAWLEKHAPEDVKFALTDSVQAGDFTDTEQQFLRGLADKVAEAPEDADGQWFHLAIYEFKESLGMQPKDMFTTLYKALIGKTSGPRAGWFLSILPRDWLIKRLRLEA